MLFTAKVTKASNTSHPRDDNASDLEATHDLPYDHEWISKSTGFFAPISFHLLRHTRWHVHPIDWQQILLYHTLFPSTESTSTWFAVGFDTYRRCMGKKSRKMRIWVLVLTQAIRYIYIFASETHELSKKLTNNIPSQKSRLHSRIQTILDRSALHIALDSDIGIFLSIHHHRAENHKIGQSCSHRYRFV